MGAEESEEEKKRIAAEKKAVEEQRKREELAPGICAICMDDDCPREMVFTGCGHMVACTSCAEALQRQLNRVDHAAKCPTCRAISLPVRVIVS